MSFSAVLGSIIKVNAICWSVCYNKKATNKNQLVKMTLIRIKKKLKNEKPDIQFNVYNIIYFRH